MTKESDAVVKIGLTKDTFTVIDNRIIETHGVGFADLATERPADAYSYIVRIVEGIISASDSVLVDNIKLTEKLDGQEAITGATRQVVEKLKVDTDIKPVDVVVSVFGKPRLRDAIRGIKTKPVEVISFHVEPPNLSF